MIKVTDTYTFYRKTIPLEHLVEKTIVEVRGLEKDSEEIQIRTQCGCEYLMYHEQDCCESVALEDLEGDVNDLVGAVVVSAEERTNSGDEDSSDRPSEYSESFTWTFYDIQTTKGSVWLRWLGESNGYYSESVSFVWINKPDEQP